MRRQAWLRLALATGSLLASGALAELTFRVLAWREYEARITAWPGDPLLEMARGTPWFYEVKPNAAYELVLPRNGGAERIVHRTDAHGWRVQPAVAAAAATQHVVCVGDSYTFGIAVRDHETFPCRLQEALRTAGADVRVSNRGVPGYNTDLQWARLRHIFAAERPDLVVLCYVMNDAEPVPNVPLPPDVLYQHCASWLFDACVPFLNALGKLAVADLPLRERQILNMQADYNRSFAHASPGWRESRAALQAMHAFLRERGVPLVVFVLPDFTQPLDDTYGYFLLHERVAEWGREAGFPTHDLLSVFFGEDHLALWVPGDGHPGPEAQRRMAEAGARELLPLLR